MTYISCDDVNTDLEKNQTETDNNLVVIAKSGLVLRAQATTSASKLGLIPFGESVKPIETKGKVIAITGKSGQWTKVQYNGISGWVFGGFLADKATANKTSELDTQIKVKFTSFHFGDAEHYEFVDENGKNWSFASNKSKIKFNVALPESQINEKNQGWGANKKFLNQWFYITWKNNKQAQYQDGPMVIVPIIVTAQILPD